MFYQISRKRDCFIRSRTKLLVFSSILIVCLCLPAAADEIPVNVKADSLKFYEDTGMVEALGSVEARLKGVTIYADRLRMDSKSNVVTAEGAVRLKARDYTAFSESIVYDPETSLSTFSDFKTNVTPSDAKGDLYLSAENLVERQNEMRGEEGSLTSCGDDTAHYTMMAERIEYYPNDKIIGYNVTFYVGGMPALWMPLLVYDLNRRHKKNWVFGHNDVEGDYIKSSWDYPYGILYLDLMEKKGFGHGTEIDYGLGALGLGTFFVYHLEETDTGITDWITRINHEKQIDEWTNISLDHSYTATYLIPSGRRDQTAFGMSWDHNKDVRASVKLNTLDDRIGALQKYAARLSHSYDKVSTDYSFNYDFSKKSPNWARNSQWLSHRRTLWMDNVMFSGKANYHNDIADEGAVGDERLEPAYEISGREANYSWRVAENWYIDLDGDRYAADNNYQYLEKLPEAAIIPDPLDLKLFTLSPVFGYGYYHEVHYVSQLGSNRSFATHRYQATLNARRSVPLGMGTVAHLGAGIDQFVYATDDQLYAYREDLKTDTNLFGWFRNNITYQKGLTDGNTPFFFDRLGTRYHNIREELTLYYLDKFNWKTDGGFNWQTGKWFDVMTNMRLSPNEKIWWNIRTGWDIENTQYKDLVNTLKLYPLSALSVEFSSVSDINIGELKSGSILYDIYFLEGQANQWRIKFSQIYEPASRQFKVRDIMVEKDLHCWTMRYTYSDYRKEFSLSFSLKALPDEPVGISSGRGFYYEGFDEELKEFKQEGAIQRY